MILGQTTASYKGLNYSPKFHGKAFCVLPQSIRFIRNSVCFSKHTHTHTHKNKITPENKTEQEKKRKIL